MTSTYAASPNRRISWVLLFLFTLSSALVVIIFGFYPETIDAVLQPLLHVLLPGQEGHNKISGFESWELGALLWSLLIGVIFYFRVPLAPYKALERLNGIALGAVLFLGLFASYFLKSNYARHVWCVALIGVVFLAIDTLQAIFHKDQSYKAEALHTLLFVDVPTVLAFAVLIGYLETRPERVRHAWLTAGTVPMPAEAEQVAIFFSGAIAFQLLVSAVMLALIQAGLLRKTLSFYYGREQH